MSDHAKMRENLAQIEILLRQDGLEEPIRQRLRVAKDRLMLLLSWTDNDTIHSYVARA